MKFGSDEHERFLAAAGGLAAKHTPVILSMVFETSMTKLERILAGDEVPDERMVQVVSELTGVTTRTLLTGKETPPRSVKEAIVLGRGQALREALYLLEGSAGWYAGPGREPERAEAIRACLPLLVVNRVDTPTALANRARARARARQ